MSKNWRATLTTLLNGLTLSTLFFYPLITALSGENINLLHWALIDSMETISSWLFVGIVFSILIYAGKYYFSNKISGIWSLILFEFCVSMALGGVIRNEPFTSVLKDHRQEINTLTIIAALLNLFLICWIYFKKSNRPQEIIRSALLIASPVNLIFILCLSTLILNPKFNSRIQIASSAEVNASKKNKAKTMTIILLFDELSPDYLYGSKKVNLDSYPTLKNMVQNSNKFMNAYLPGGRTAVAIPNLFNHNHDGINLKNLLENKNKDSRAMGWSLDYCTEIIPRNRNCSSTSIFNARTLTNEFSLTNQIWTNLNLLPYQKPYGFLKIPAAAAMHRRTLTKTNQWLSNQIKDLNSELIYAHFNIPHPPMLDEKTIGYYDSKRFDINEKNYLRQFKYIDEVLASLSYELESSKIKNNVNLIILSDHNVRALISSEKREQIVLLYKPADNHKINSISLNKKENASDIIITIIKKVYGKNELLN